MLLITTPTGNTGRHALHTALSANERVRVLVRDPDRLGAEVRDRVEVVQGDLRDPAALAAALRGIEGAFFCVPQSPDPDDLDAHYRSFTEPFAQAARAAGVRRLVTISGGDGREDNRGPGRQLHDLERSFDRAGFQTRHVRCGYFMENFLWMAHGIAGAGMFALPVAGSVPIAFVAARDIGVGAGQLLLDRTWDGQGAVQAHGPRSLTCEEAARTASLVLGIPVRFQPITAEQYTASLARYGVSAAMGESLGQMFAAISEGRDMGSRSAPELPCTTTLQAWMAEELAPAVATLRAGETPA